MPPALTAAEVLDATGAPHRLGSAWQAHDALVVFVRHFACCGCAEHLAAIKPRLPELAALEVGVTIVGSGTADQLAGFVEREELARPGVACFTDPTLAAFRAAGLQRSRWGTFGPIAIGQLVRAQLHGHRQGRTQGDLTQQGGALYITRAGEVAFYHRSRSLGDHARLADIVDVALAARAIDAEAS